MDLQNALQGDLSLEGQGSCQLHSDCEVHLSINVVKNCQLTLRPSNARNGAKTMGYTFSKTASANTKAATEFRSACLNASAERQRAATNESIVP